jgi:hypothetical protein
MRERREKCERAPGGTPGRDPASPTACFAKGRLGTRARPLLDRGLLDETIDPAFLGDRIDRALHQLRQLVRAVRQLPHLATPDLGDPFRKLGAARQAVVDVQLTLLGVTVGQQKGLLRSTSDTRRERSSRLNSRIG